MGTEQKKSISRFGRNLRIAVYFLIAFAVLVGGYFSNLYGRFQRDHKELAVAMRDGDLDTVERQVDVLIQYNELAHKWHLSGYTDKYLFKDMMVYRATETLLKRDFRALIDDKSLDQGTDNHLMAHILGVARAKYYQGLYQDKLNSIKSKKTGPTEKDKAELNEIVQKVITEARPYFRLAVDNSPGNDLHYEYPFNYDLLQNEESARKALENPGEQPPPMGYGDGPPGKKPVDGKDGGNKLNPGDRSQPGGSGAARKPKG